MGDDGCRRRKAEFEKFDRFSFKLRINYLNHSDTRTRQLSCNLWCHNTQITSWLGGLIPLASHSDLKSHLCPHFSACPPLFRVEKDFSVDLPFIPTSLILLLNRPAPKPSKSFNSIPSPVLETLDNASVNHDQLVISGVIIPRL
jgi:hypothetical protein